MTRILDCVVIGAGPAGLVAATYLGRYRRHVMVVDGGRSRARYIPTTHNSPGFPGGISGTALLARMRDHAATCDVGVVGDEVMEIQHDGERFRVNGKRGELTARAVILATGCEDILPAMDGIEDAVDCGAVRLCPVCDGYEAMHQDIAVYGDVDAAASHARFLRTYSTRVTVVPVSEPATEDQARELAADGITVAAPAAQIAFDGGKCVFSTDGRERCFDVVYLSLGCRQKSGLATTLGARCDDERALLVTPHQMTSVEGLYAIGDVVSALNQIAVASGHAAIAATDVHNRLPRNFTA